MNFLVSIKLSLDFYKIQISTNCKKIILKFFVLFARHGTILAVVREITSIKMYNFRIKSENVQNVYF
jgi:hypothetical protein